MSNPLNDVLAGAMRLLAIREHSQHELRRKLKQKGHEPEQIEQAIEQMVEQRLQSDERYIESFINSHRERGQGPKRIRMELQQHQLNSELIEAYLDERSPIWRQNAAQVRIKKYGHEMPEDFKERIKQTRFLEYRGFDSEQIRYIFNELD